MKKTLITAALYLAANAIGLLAATLLVSGFTVDFLSFVIVVVVFSVILVVLRPLIEKLAKDKVAALQGGIALITTYVGLFATNLLLPGLSTGGMINLLIATLVVWLGTMIASIILPSLLGQSTAKPKA